jgi:hypothetical protein
MRRVFLALSLLFAACGTDGGSAGNDLAMSALPDGGRDFAMAANHDLASPDLSPPPDLFTGSDAGPLPPWVAALAIGAWYQIPNTAISSVDPMPTPNGDTGPKSKVFTWTSFIVDTRTSRLYSVANGGHRDYSGNEVDMLDLSVAQPAWQQLLAPTPNDQIGDCNSYYADGHPASRHTYYGVTLDVANDRIMLFGGVPWCSMGGFHFATSSYQIGANQWNPANMHPDVPRYFSSEPAYTLDPATGDVYGAQDQNYGRWNRATNDFTDLNPKGTGAQGTGAPSAMDTKRGRIYVVGGQKGDSHHYTLATDTWAAATLTGTDAATVQGSGQGGMIYLPAIDAFLLRLAGAGGTVYQIDAATFAVTQFPTSGGDTIPATQNGPYNKFLYVPHLGGCVYVPDHGTSIWFLRTN